MICKCGECTELIKTEGNRFFKNDGRNWLEVIEYRYCPYCYRKYKMYFSGYADDDTYVFDLIEE